jgi:hydrocephalus-inducing protein
MDNDRLPQGANVSNEAFFKCIFLKGVCLSGKKYEMVFEYAPDIQGLHESYWEF